MNTNTIEIVNRGMRCLTEQLGAVEAEKFIAAVIRNKFDYTEWQKEFFDAKAAGQFHEESLEYAAANPYEGGAERV
ncbi:MAG: hypothetical protein IJ128_05585 [Firmicutes bacterium]|nr:hypothetical protein [Bacillota bacterium]